MLEVKVNQYPSRDQEKSRIYKSPKAVLEKSALMAVRFFLILELIDNQGSVEEPFQTSFTLSSNRG